MVALVWLVIIAIASLLVVRLGTTALVLTGLERDTSEFQAYSAFFGVGFTTRESTRRSRRIWPLGSCCRATWSSTKVRIGARS